MFTRRHYKGLAESLRKSYPVRTSFRTDQAFFSAVDQWHRDAFTLAAMLYDDNDRFDRHRFMESAAP